MMKKVAFLFGAGAEGKNNFDIPMGYEYLKSSLYASDTLKGFDDALSTFFKDRRYFGDKFTYSKNTFDVSNFVLKNFITQHASHNRDFFKKYEDDVVTILSDEDLRHIADELGEKPQKHKSSTDKEKIKDIKKEFKEILTGQKRLFSDIQSDIIREIFREGSKGQIDYDLNIGIAGTLDSYFHTIIDPYKYSVVRFSKIFNYYWACYFTILKSILIFLSSHGQDKFKVYLNYIEDKGIELNYSAVLNNVEQLTKDLYDLDTAILMQEDSYYQNIKEALDKHNKELQCCGVITTNYYRFCEAVSPNTVYLNGQLKYFEYPELLEVVDLTEISTNKDNLFFPFMFGQSLVKPIVNSVQTEEFHKLNKLLNDVDILVVFGFNINEDDNHINAFIHDYVKKGKKLIIVSDAENFNVRKKLKCSDSEVTICNVTYGKNREVINKVFDEILQSSA